MAEKRKPYVRIMPPDYMGGGPVRFMAAAEGHAMVRRPGCAPFVVGIKDWNSWPETEQGVLDARAGLSQSI